MGAIAKSYDLKKVILVIAGIPITGYGEDNAIEIEWVAPIWDVTTGADGLTVASKNNNTDARATITLSERSTGYAALGALLKTQELNPLPVLIPLPFMLVDSGSGETISSAYTIFLDRPPITKGKTASDRVFTVHLPGAAVGALYGPGNVI